MRPMLKKILLLTMIWTPAYAGMTSLAGDQSITLKQVYHTASNNQPRLKARKQSVLQAKYAEQEALTGLLPQITASHTSLFEKEKSYKTSQHTLSLRGSQIIFAPGGPLSDRALARYDRERAQHALQLADNDVHRTVTKAFLGAWLAQEERGLMEALRAHSASEFALQEQQRRMRTISEHDFAKAKAEHAAQQARLAAYPQRAASARTALAMRIGGEESEAQLRYLPFPLADLKPEEHYQKLAHAHRPELAIQDTVINRHTTAAQAHRRSYLPTLSASAKLAHTFAGHDHAHGTDAYVSFSLSMPVFDGMRRTTKAWQAEAAAQAAAFEKQDVVNTITREVSEAYAALVTTRSKLKSAQVKKQEMAGIVTRDKMQRTLKSISEQELLKSIYNYEESAHELRSAQVALRKAEEDMAYYCGYGEQVYLDPGFRRDDRGHTSERDHRLRGDVGALNNPVVLDAPAKAGVHTKGQL